MAKRKVKQLSGPEIFSKHQRVISDIDAIICDTTIPATNLFKKILKEKFGKNIDLSFIEIPNIKQFDQFQVWGVKCGLTYEEADNINRKIWDSEEVLVKSKPIGGAIEFFKWVLASGKDLHFMTSRPATPKKIKRWTIDWIKYWLPDVKKQNIHIRENHEISGGDFKGKIVNELNGGIILDDFHEHAKRVIELTDNVDRHLVLVPYAGFPATAELKKHRDVTVIKRSDKQDLVGVHSFFKAKL